VKRTKYTALPLIYSEPRTPLVYKHSFFSGLTAVWDRSIFCLRFPTYKCKLYIHTYLRGVLSGV